MKKTGLYFVIMIALSSLGFPAKAQSSYPKKYNKTIETFIEGYNRQNYRKVKKSLGLLAKIFSTRKIIMGQYLQPRFKKYGKLIRLGVPSYPEANVVLFPLIFEKDSTEIEYLALTFTKKNKITGIYFSGDNIIYKKINNLTTIDSIVKPYLSFKHHTNTGLIIGVYDKGKRSVFSYGETIKGSGAKPNDSTLFQIGSITKTFTGILLANGINDHLLDSLSPLSSFLPDSIPKLTYKGKEINLLNLVMHTSALPREPSNFDSTIADERDPFANYQEKDLLNYLKTEKLKYKVGKEYNYSNTGMGLLGYILSKHKKTTYEDLLVKEICDKLEMNDTRTMLSEAQKKRTAKSYYQGKETPDFSFNAPFIGAGGIYSSVSDMLKYIEANLHPEKTSIEKDLALAQQPHRVNKYVSMGLAWDISQLIISNETLTVIGHSGNTMGTSSFMVLSREKDVGIIVFSNSNVPVDDVGLLILKLMLKRR